MTDDPSVLLLTPMKNARKHLCAYWEGIERLTYAADRISLGVLVSDSADGTYDAVAARLPALRDCYCRVGLWQRDFGFTLPESMPRWHPAIQAIRRSVLAKSRNHLLFHALDAEDWVLWLDVDVIEYPPDIIERLLALDRKILHPHCVKDYGGPTFDLNGWRDHATLHMDDLRERGDLVRLDAVGGTMLLVHADVHRDGLIFPLFPYGERNPLIRSPNPYLGERSGELETEGLGIMASDMGHQCWGLPNLEIRHLDA